MELKSHVPQGQIEAAAEESHAVFQETHKKGEILAPQIASRQITTTCQKSISSRPLRTILLGTPSPTSTFLSMITFLANLAAVLMSADFFLSARLYYPSHDISFVRLGYVSHNEARFLIREPDMAKLPITLDIRLKDPHSPFDDSRWQKGGDIREIANNTDFTVPLTVRLSDSHQHAYEWRTSNNYTGEFIAPPRPGQFSEYHGGNFTFLATSCILPRFPYSPSNQPLTIPGLRHLAHSLPSLGAQFMLFLGDFIYIDVPRRFGKTKEDYLQKYRQVYASPDWLPVSQNLSWIHTLDDHEIENDWSSNTTGVYQAAFEPWRIYNGAVNPPRARIGGSGSLRSNATYYEFTQGPASFFLLDTRTYRSNVNSPVDSRERTMLGNQQLGDLLAWLDRSEPKGVKWKVVASSVPFTKNWPVNNKDTWGGFLAERSLVLEAMWKAGSRGIGIVIVSGDRHEFAATRFPPPRGSPWSDLVAPHEFSVSPLNQFAFPLPTYRQRDDGDVMLKYAHVLVSPLHQTIPCPRRPGGYLIYSLIGISIVEPPSLVRSQYQKQVSVKTRVHCIFAFSSMAPNDGVLHYAHRRCQKLRITNAHSGLYLEATVPRSKTG